MNGGSSYESCVAIRLGRVYCTYNRVIARRRIQAEHNIGRLRRFDALTIRDRQHRTGHTRLVCAVVGLVNRQLAA